MPKRKKINVYVLMGGPSAEHEVSLNTGKLVLKNLAPTNFNVRPVLITKSGQWLVGDGRRRMLLATTRPAGDGAHSVLGSLSSLRSNPARSPAHVRSKHASAPVKNIVFIAMHGTYGEDGTVQGLLELAGIPYTGSGVLASALAMDKPLSADVFRANGILTPDFVTFSKLQWQKENSDLKKKISRLGYPIVIKPTNLGSSVGITIIDKPGHLSKAVKLALAHSPVAMAQKYVKGKELTCAVIDDGIPDTEMPLQPTEIIPKTSAFFDYYAKYTPGASREITPPNLPKPMIKKIRETALACHRGLGCSGMSRTDMILAGKKLYVLEVNTIPGLTETSLLPQAAKACGISFPQLLEHIIKAGVKRFRETH